MKYTRYEYCRKFKLKISYSKFIEGHENGSLSPHYKGYTKYMREKFRPDLSYRGFQTRIRRYGMKFAITNKPSP